LKALDGTIPRFVAIGLMATLLHVCIGAIAGTSLRLSPAAANLSGFVVATAWGYLGNFYWTFAARTAHVSSIGRFALLAVATLALSSAIVHIVCERFGLPLFGALALVAVLVPPVNYVIARFYAFKVRPEETGSPGGWLEIAILVATVGIAFCFYAGTTFNHDTSWYFIATARWLDGATLYRDIMEINPPLAFYLTAPSIWLSKAISGLTHEAAYAAFMAVICMVSLLWARRLLIQTTGPLVHFVMLGAVAAGFLVTPISVFGQREHLMAVFSLPYVLAVALNADCGRWERVLLGLYAMLGLALKPYFLVIPLFLVSHDLVRTRGAGRVLRAEHVAIGLGCLAYLLAIALLHPRYLETIVPMGRLVYDAYRASFEQVLQVSAVIGALLATLAYIQSRFPCEEKRKTAESLLVVVAATLLAYLWQGKGWVYQFIPVNIYLGILIAWLCVSASPRPKKQAPRVLVLALAAMVVLSPALRGPYHSQMAQVFGRFLATDGSQSSFVFLGAHVWGSYPMANTHDAEVTSRYSALWLIPGAVRQLSKEEPVPEDRREALLGVLDFARTSTIEDFLEGRPQVVIVDVRSRKTYFDGTDFDYLAFFQQDPRFAEAWRDYRLIETLHGFEVWRRS
jgi:putative flippase GtrA